MNHEIETRLREFCRENLTEVDQVERLVQLVEDAVKAEQNATAKLIAELIKSTKGMSARAVTSDVDKQLKSGYVLACSHFIDILKVFNSEE